MHTTKRLSMMVIAMSMLVVPMCMTVMMKSLSLPASGSMNKPYTVFLTFDDGPSANTDKVLTVLFEENVQGTFFVVGETSEQGIALYNRILAEGHALGLHSYAHDMQGVYRNMYTFQEDFLRLESWVYACTGTSVDICRMVGGSYSIYCKAAVREQVLTYLSGKGYACYDWDIDAKDSGAYALPAARLAQNVINAARKKPNEDLIILMHDDPLRTTLADALKIIIPYFKEQGYVFDVLTKDTESVKRLMPKTMEGGNGI